MPTQDTDWLDDIFNNLYIWDNTASGAIKIEESLVEAKQAITSLIKELVAEAKPPHVHGTTVSSGQFNRGVSEFEQNILKALEEK